MYEDKRPAHFVETKLVNPEEANALLDLALQSDFDNRNINVERVNHFSEVIEKGDWQDSNDMVCIDESGILINGYHRLTAIKKSGIPIWVTMKRGMDRDSFKSMDTGKKRSPSDMLTIKGRKNTSTLARALKLYYLYETKGIKVFEHSMELHTVISNNEIDRLDDLHRSIDNSVTYVRSLLQLNKLLPAGFLAFAHYLFMNKHDISIVNPYFDGLNKDGNSESDSPVNMLRNRLIEDKLAIGSWRLELRHKIALFIKCWNYTLEGTPIKVLRYSPQNESMQDFK